jgi:hypothetical protein
LSFKIINLKLCGKQYNKIDILHPIVVPQLSGGCQHNYSTKTRQAGRADEQSLYSLMSMVWYDRKLVKALATKSSHRFEVSLSCQAVWSG